jgi:D-alanine-D-alanine ligase
MAIFKFWEHPQVTISSTLLNVVLIAHVREPRGYINNTQLQCSEIERFSIDEFNEIYQGIVAAGYFVQAIFFNEIDFINSYIEHPEDYKSSLIYTLARNGLGDNKKTIIPSFCELLGLKYTTSPSLSCALARNKYYFSTIFNAHNVPVPKSWLHTDMGTWLNGAPDNGTKVICKPASESASQGITESKIITASPDLDTKLYNKSYIVQEYIEGSECEVPVFKFGNTIHVFPPIGIDLKGKNILDEAASDNNQYDFYPLEKYFSLDTVTTIQKITERAFRLLQMDVYGRIDFRITKNGQPYIFDVSTTPYTTKHSSFAYAFKQLGFEYEDIYRAVISAAIIR